MHRQSHARLSRSQWRALVRLGDERAALQQSHAENESARKDLDERIATLAAELAPAGPTNSPGVVNALCAGGDTTVFPMGTPRVAAISALTLAPGSTPPRPGLAPCDNLIEIAFTEGNCDFSAKVAASNRPSASRTE
jgi:hypothetical protein